MEREYYCDEITAVPYDSLLRGLSQGLPVPLARIIAWWFRLRGRLGWKLAPKFGVAGSQYAAVLMPEQVPASAAAKWAPVMEQLHDLSFGVIQYRQPRIIGAREDCFCLLRHTSGIALATVEWIRMRGAGQVEEAVALEFNSYAAEDPEILTGSLKPEHLHMADAVQPPFVDVVFYSNTIPLRAVWQKHEERISGRGCISIAPEAAVAFHLQRAQRRLQWLLESGIARHLSAKEIARVELLTLQP